MHNGYGQVTLVTTVMFTFSAKDARALAVRTPLS
jgi:hypothetical protein